MAETLAKEVPTDVQTQDVDTTGVPPRRAGRRPKRHRGRYILLAVLLLLLVGGYFLWKYLGTYESTDDSQVDGHIHAISSRISGYVSRVLVEDQQIVKAGDPLVVIDPRDYQVAVARGEADVADAEATAKGSRINIPITSTTTTSTFQSAQNSLGESQAALLTAQHQSEAAQASLTAAQAQVTEADANYRKALDDAARYKLLVDKDEISRQIWDQAEKTAEANKATLDNRVASVGTARQNAAAAAAVVDQAQARVKQSEASLRSAQTWPEQVAVRKHEAESSTAKVAQQKASLAQAKLNLGYTTIFAPSDGIIGKKTVEVGQYISPGQQLMALVQLSDVWIIANFKETQLRRMQSGQRVRFSVDAYSRMYHGRVTGIGGATGSRFSLLPPENATGNYVKVVQRIPVRIDLDPGENKDLHLRPGMSVDPKVYLE